MHGFKRQSRGQAALRGAARAPLQKLNWYHYLHAPPRRCISGSSSVNLVPTAVLFPSAVLLVRTVFSLLLVAALLLNGIIRSDSTDALANAELPVGLPSDKFKHIQNAFFFFRQNYHAGWVDFHHIPGLHNPADALIKGFK
jgi:hypothetical protein